MKNPWKHDCCAMQKGCKINRANTYPSPGKKNSPGFFRFSEDPPPILDKVHDHPTLVWPDHSPPLGGYLKWWGVSVDHGTGITHLPENADKAQTNVVDDVPRLEDGEIVIWVVAQRPLGVEGLDPRAWGGPSPYPQLPPPQITSLILLPCPSLPFILTTKTGTCCLRPAPSPKKNIAPYHFHLVFRMAPPK